MKKVTPSFLATHCKNWGSVKGPFFENWVGGSTLPAEGGGRGGDGGAHCVLLLIHVCWYKYNFFYIYSSKKVFLKVNNLSWLVSKIFTIWKVRSCIGKKLVSNFCTFKTLSSILYRWTNHSNLLSCKYFLMAFSCSLFLSSTAKNPIF